jgi:hypothetical protein
MDVRGVQAAADVSLRYVGDRHFASDLRIVGAAAKLQIFDTNGSAAISQTRLGSRSFGKDVKLPI